MNSCNYVGWFCEGGLLLINRIVNYFFHFRLYSIVGVVKNVIQWSLKYKGFQLDFGLVFLSFCPWKQGNACKSFIKHRNQFILCRLCVSVCVCFAHQLWPYNQIHQVLCWINKRWNEKAWAYHSVNPSGLT